jgi:uncharacterized membrane protein
MFRRLSFINDLWMITAIGLCLLVLNIFTQRLLISQPLHLLLGVFYALFAPGYALTAALFPHGEDLDQIERLGLSIGLSVAWLPLLALILDRLAWGLRLWPILLGQLCSVLLFSSIATWRRARLFDRYSSGKFISWQPGAWWIDLGEPEKRLFLLCGVIVLLVSFATAYTFLVPSQADFYTEFYMFGKSGLVEDYPRRTAVDERIYVSIGIANRERSAQIYRLEAWASEPWIDGRRALITEIGPMRLEVGEMLEWPFFFSMPWSGKDQQVEFLLYRPEDEQAYRRLQLWIDVDP